MNFPDRQFSPGRRAYNDDKPKRIQSVQAKMTLLRGKKLALTNTNLVVRSDD